MNKHLRRLLEFWLPGWAADMEADRKEFVFHFVNFVNEFNVVSQGNPLLQPSPIIWDSPDEKWRTQ